MLKNLNIAQLIHSLYGIVPIQVYRSLNYNSQTVYQEKDMASDVNDITIQYEEDGVVIVREIDKEILSKGSWATVLFRYQQWDRRKNEYGSDSYTIRRYQKIHGEYLQKSKFTISSSKQAEKIVATLQKWLKD